MTEPTVPLAPMRQTFLIGGEDAMVRGDVRVEMCLWAEATSLEPDAGIRGLQDRCCFTCLTVNLHQTSCNSVQREPMPGACIQEADLVEMVASRWPFACRCRVHKPLAGAGAGEGVEA